MTRKLSRIRAQAALALAIAASPPPPPSPSRRRPAVRRPSRSSTAADARDAGRPVVIDRVSPDARDAGRPGRRRSTCRSPRRRATTGRREPAPVVSLARPRRVPRDGFDWLDAGIGAGGARRCSSLVGTGAAATFRTRRAPVRAA